MADRRKRLLGGLLSTVVGVLTAAMVYGYPERLNAPAWVAYAACSGLVVAGLTIIVAESPLRRTHTWLCVACTVALLVPGIWVAFGPGVRECSISVPFFSTAGSELLCRGAFGLGAFIVAALLIWVVLRALRQQNIS
ncbi:MAG TPA: hypothetical protein VJT81_02415 [Burkholderiales bacterium]|nr:hypothetical protein [Burkholderiales bacterium]